MSLSAEQEWASRFHYNTYTDPVDWSTVAVFPIKSPTLTSLQGVIRTLSFGNIAADDLKRKNLHEVHHFMLVMQAALQYVLHCQQFLLQSYHTKKSQQTIADPPQPQQQLTLSTNANVHEDKNREIEKLKQKLERMGEKLIKAKGQRDEARQELVRVLQGTGAQHGGTTQNNLVSQCPLCQTNVLSLSDHLLTSCVKLQTPCGDCGTMVLASLMSQHRHQCSKSVKRHLPQHFSWDRCLRCSKCEHLVCPTDPEALITWASQQHVKNCPEEVIPCEVCGQVMLRKLLANHEKAEHKNHTGPHTSVPQHTDPTLGTVPVVQAATTAPSSAAIPAVCEYCGVHVGTAPTASIKDSLLLEHLVTCEYRPSPCPMCLHKFPHKSLIQHAEVCSAKPNTIAPLAPPPNTIQNPPPPPPILTLVHPPAIQQPQPITATPTAECPICRATVDIRDFAYHQSLCSQRPRNLSCEKCYQIVGQYTTDAQKESLRLLHDATCDSVVVRCPRCDVTVVRKNLTFHMNACSPAPLPTIAPQQPIPRQEVLQAPALITVSCAQCHRHLGDVHTSDEQNTLLLQHEQSCEEKPVKCTECGAMMTSQKLAKHKMECPERKVEVTCPECQMKLGRTTSVESTVLMAKHALSCELRTITCEHCGMKLPFRDLASHNAICKPRIAHLVTCYRCKGILGTVYDDSEEDVLLQQHTATCPERLVTCPSCNSMIVAKDLAAHTATCDAQKKYDVDCDYCGKVIQTVSSLEERKAVSDAHRKECEYRLVECGECGTQVSFKMLGLHAKNCGKSVSCPDCAEVVGKAATDHKARQLLLAHQQTCDEALEPCAKCGRDIRRVNMENHKKMCSPSTTINVHTAKCLRCHQVVGEATSEEGKQAMLSVHDNSCLEKLVECPNCNKEYFRKETAAHQAECSQSQTLQRKSSASGRTRDSKLHELYKELEELERQDSQSK